MPDLGWRRRRRRAAATVGAPPALDPKAEPATSQERQAWYLRHATSCYLRGGELSLAADCLTQLGEHEQAAVLQLRAGRHRAAAQAYASGGEPEKQSWIYAHYLGDSDTARSILRRADQPAVPDLPGSPVAAAALPPWADRLGLLRHTLEHLGLGDAGTGAPPAGSEQTRQRIGAAAAQLTGDLGRDPDVAALLEQVRELKQAAIAENDWAAGYAARELERVLADDQDQPARPYATGIHRAGGSAVLALSRRQVLARCDAIDGAPHERIIPVLTETQELLANRRAPWAEHTEAWAVAIAEVIRRYDQAALIYAAAVRGGRPEAARRWREWSDRVLEPAPAASPAIRLTESPAASPAAPGPDADPTPPNPEPGEPPDQGSIVPDQEQADGAADSPSDVSTDAGPAIRPDNGGFQHYILKTETEQAISDQTAVSGLCGWTWIPQRARSVGDKIDDLPVCPECKAVYESLPHQ
jgi:hypothetical protein